VSDDRLDAITAIWLHLPLPICAACAHPWTGIAASKVKDPRTGGFVPRRFVPSNPEIREWCNQYAADLHEIASQPFESPAMAPVWPAPTAEESAHVWRVVNQIKERCNRVLGIQTAEDQRAEAERILEAARQC